MEHRSVACVAVLAEEAVGGRGVTHAKCGGVLIAMRTFTRLVTTYAYPKAYVRTAGDEHNWYRCDKCGLSGHAYR